MQAQRVLSLTFTLYSPSINHTCSTQAGQMNPASSTQTNSSQHCAIQKMLTHLKPEIKEIKQIPMFQHMDMLAGELSLDQIIHRSISINI